MDIKKEIECLKKAVQQDSEHTLRTLVQLFLEELEKHMVNEGAHEMGKAIDNQIANAWPGSHSWEPDDTQGTSMTCTRCHQHVNIDDSPDWDQKVEGQCPGSPVMVGRPWPGCCGMCVHPDECQAKEKEHMWKQAMLVGRYISVYKPIAGWKAIHYWWNNEDPKMGFWLPWSINDSAFNTKAEAERYAKAWASDESLPYIPNDSEKE